MKISAIIQTVIIMLIVAAAASCSTGKEYANRVFGSKAAPAKDSAAIRFLENDSMDDYENGSVYIKVEKPKADTTVNTKKETEEVTEPVAPPANTSNNGTRTKRKRSGE